MPLINAPSSCARLALLLLAAAVALPATTMAADKVYKWTDENGVVHYSAHPPEQGDAEAVAIRRGPSAPPPSVDAAPALDEDALRQAECTRSRARLQVLLANEVVEVEQADSTRQRLSAEERLAEITRTEAEVQRWCAQRDGN